MVRLPVDDAEKFCQWCLTDFSHEGQTIMMAPGSGFYTNPSDGHDQVRMAYVLNKEDLGRAMVVLRHALEECNALFGFMFLRRKIWSYGVVDLSILRVLTTKIPELARICRKYIDTTTLFAGACGRFAAIKQ